MLFPAMLLHAQDELQNLEKIEKCIRDYQDLSTLGNPGSPYVDTATINAFRELFELNATLYWDLYLSKTPKPGYLPQVDAYADSAIRLYNNMKPNVFYGKRHIIPGAGGKTAVVYLVKINHLPDENPEKKTRGSSNIMTLKLLLNIYSDNALIQNISRDTRLARIRSLSVQAGYSFITSLSGDLFGKPVSAVVPGVTSDYSTGKPYGYTIGLLADIRLNRQHPDGLLLSTGLLYSGTGFDISVTNYENAYRQTFGCSSQPEYNCEGTVVDRAPSVSEKITINSVSIPVTLKWYLPGKNSGHRPDRSSGPRLKYYLRAGPQISLLSGTTRVGYYLSHSAEGKFFYVSQANLPDSARTWFYLDDQDAINIFSNKNYNYAASVRLNKLCVSALAAFGIEAKINSITIGLEPWLNIGITPVTCRPGRTGYNLYPAGDFTSFLETYKTIRITSFGVNVFIGNLFSRKY